MTMWFRASLVGVMLAVAVPASAQVAGAPHLAREAAAAGRRPEALALLASHLAVSPRDVDARLLYGLVLSWERQYDEARRELRQVLEEAPQYTDARLALMNVEWWSGQVRDARATADSILARDPGNRQARLIRDRLDAASRPWRAGVTYANDSFSDGRPAWHESALTLSRLTPRGTLIVRASDARRFGRDDQMVEAEAYPRLGVRTYAFVSVGVAPDPVLYPSTRVAFDLHQAAGGGFEISGGVRRLAFDSPTMIYSGGLNKYVGPWMLTGKVSHIPGEGALDSTSYHGGFRRYLRGDGISYAGVMYGHGFSREEIRNATDLATVDSDTARVEVKQRLARRLEVFAAVAASRQHRQDGRRPLWQTSVAGGLMVGP